MPYGRSVLASGHLRDTTACTACVPGNERAIHTKTSDCFEAGPDQFRASGLTTFARFAWYLKDKIDKSKRLQQILPKWLQATGPNCRRGCVTINLPINLPIHLPRKRAKDEPSDVSTILPTVQEYLAHKKTPIPLESP